MRNRNSGVLIYLSEKERKHLEQQAQVSGLSMSNIIRKLIMGIEIRPRPPDNIPQLIRAVNAVGNNINQIARKVNTFDEVSQAQLSEIYILLEKIYREVKQ